MARVSGVTIPLFSIRTRADWGIGQITDLPVCAEWLMHAGQRLLQVLPANELTDGETSPYGALSAFAIDPIYINVEQVPDLDEAARARVLGSEGHAELERVRNGARVDYRAVRALKKRVLAEAFQRFRTTGLARDDSRARTFRAFIEKESTWLCDHALYCALRASHASWGWSTWPVAERDRDPELVRLASRPTDDGALGTSVLEQMYLQWIAHEQWIWARSRMNALGVVLMGDMPFIVGNESVDVWANRNEFRTDVSLGAPPDPFSPEGQSWGLPAYDWDAMDRNDLGWIRARSRRAATLFDRFRIDHVVGFFRQWVRKGREPGYFLPSSEDDQRARGDKVLRAIIDAAGAGAVIAEDLGMIPPFVREAMSRLNLPGYKVLPWERDERSALRDPRAAFPTLSVATFSTHDTAPITQWWYDFADWERESFTAFADVHANQPEDERELRLFELLLSARSDLTLFLASELLGDKSRINTPGIVNDQNWTWRLPRPIEDLAGDPALMRRFERVRALTAASGRIAP
ncbi:MAG: 4-alpha-glucanotransferase [Polyangiaceae bacterium]|nr:4-alpha-glucanotransferase [Polyangiaceae bacterium]